MSETVEKLTGVPSAKWAAKFGAGVTGTVAMERKLGIRESEWPNDFASLVDMLELGELAIDWQFATAGALTPAIGPTAVLTRATVGNYINASGVMAEAAINAARFHYAVVDGVLTAVGLLLEPERTNQYLANTVLDNGNWSVTNLTRTTGQTGIGGGTTATRFTDSSDGAAAIHRFWQGVACTSGTTYCASIFVKPETQKRFLMYSSSTLTFFVMFDLENETVSIDKDYNAKGFIEKYPNGWYRIGIVKAAEATATANIIHYFVNGAGDEYQGDGTKTAIFDHPQFEAGDGPTMPIVTAGAPVTRSADVVSVSGSGFTSIYNAAAVTLLMDIRRQPGAPAVLATLNDNSSNNFIRFAGDAPAGSPVAKLAVTAGGEAQANVDSERALLVYTPEIMALSVAANSGIVAKNGHSPAADSTLTMPSGVDRLQLSAFNGCIRRLRLVAAASTSEVIDAETLPTRPAAKLQRIIFDGNSLTVGTVGGDVNYPAKLGGLLGDDYRHLYLRDFSVGGQRTADMNSDRVAQINPEIVSGRTILIAWEISNELVDGTDPRVALDEMWTYCDAVRALGAKVIVVNVLPRVEGGGIPAGFNAARATVNSMMATEWTSHADALADVAGSSVIGDDADAANTTYYTDGTHLTAAGAAIVAAIIEPLVRQCAESLA